MKKIVLASVLKPVNDVRMYKKFGISIADTGKYEVIIAGYTSAAIPDRENISFYSIYDSKRTSLSRLILPARYLRFLIKVKPEIIIVNTPELLPVISIYRILFGGKIYYDVLENYYKNFLYLPSYSKPFNYIKAAYVRGIEWLSRPFISHYFLAEECYSSELRFTKRKSSIIRNTFAGEIRQNYDKIPQNPVIFCITGTLAREYGTDKAILFTNIISNKIPVVLKISGFAPDPVFRKHLKELLENKNTNLSVEINDISLPAPHSDIVSALNTSDFALCPYIYNKAFKDKIPAKFYEFLALKIPVLVPIQYGEWIDFLGKYEACIPVSFESPDIESVITAIKEHKFFKTAVPEDSISWKADKVKLLKHF
jgi:hypothetical protein